jgi:hypothetical protein
MGAGRETRSGKKFSVNKLWIEGEQFGERARKFHAAQGVSGKEAE